jgi:hypothetical protein
MPTIGEDNAQKKTLICNVPGLFIFYPIGQAGRRYYLKGRRERERLNTGEVK